MPHRVEDGPAQPPGAVRTTKARIEGLPGLFEQLVAFADEQNLVE